ncbi:glutathionylspermidine synthase family protein [Pilimelia columellifera]|uniref:Glutathionylspermidine synthase family protein n=1 Tax=Pilimelia columellifera subsp. columellifera TaxID=706583 RepID=A0ABN3N6E6_9ACTN
MRRIPHGTVRPGWESLVRADGLVFLDTTLPDGAITKYWREGPYYELTGDEVAELERHTATLFAMCVAAGDHMVANPRIMRRMGIPEEAFAEIARTWEAEPPSVYARFDLRYAGPGPQATADPGLAAPKLLEFNADTPTSLLESAVVQWRWFEQTRQGRDQWNSLHERLVAAWRRQLDEHARRLGRPIERVHFVFTAEESSGEDQMNTTYLADTALQAGYEVDVLVAEDLGLGDDGDFYDLQRRRVDVLFKLYPWEWMVDDDFGPAALSASARPGGLAIVEPVYKMLWSNKGLLPVLWELFGDDPERGRLLLPAYFADDDHQLDSYVIKPLLGREGANVRIVDHGRTVADVAGPYGAEGHVVQQFAPLPQYLGADGAQHPVLGAWIVDGEPAGLAIRESDGLVTDNASYFVPHAIV